jgi:hypothetical protein
VHLVGFIIRIYHDARASECQIVMVFQGGGGLFMVLGQWVNHLQFTEA